MTILAFITIDGALVGSVARSTAPILLAALGGLLCDRVGLFNIGLEGLMLTGAFAAVVGNYYTGSWGPSILVAVAAAALLGAVMGVTTVTCGGDVVVSAVAVNLFAIGTSAYLLRQLFDTSGTFSDPSLTPLPRLSIPGLEALPGIGPAFRDQSVLVYAGWVLAVAVSIFLYRHPIGLRLRGIGEAPDAAASLGVHVSRYQFLALVAAGAACGLAGAQLSLGNVTLFAEGMTAGRGWIAVVAVMLGRGRPAGVLAATLVFGTAEAVGFRLQLEGFPTQVTEALPYAVTLIALVTVQLSRRRVPARTGA